MSEKPIYVSEFDCYERSVPDFNEYLARWLLDSQSEDIRRFADNELSAGLNSLQDGERAETALLTLLGSQSSDVSSASGSEIWAALQLTQGLKKFSLGGNAAQRRIDAMQGFHDRNEAVRVFSSQGSRVADMILERMRALLTRVLPYSETWRPRFGPGAVLEGVPTLRRWDYLASLRELGGLREGSVTDIAHALQSEEGCVKLCAVPKTWRKDRLITVEPMLATYVQQGVRRLLMESIHSGPLRGTVMDSLRRGSLPDSLQMERALAGSESSRPWDTVDLKDASDSIPWSYVQRAFPTWVVSYLEVCRSPFYRWEGRPEELAIYAGMGNATTFIVEGLYFWAACTSILSMMGLKPRYGLVGVFGDDITLPNLGAGRLEVFELLKALGLHVNQAKSFGGKAPFRESCGVYAFKGMDVRPTRLRGLRFGSVDAQEALAAILKDLWRDSHRIPLKMVLARYLSECALEDHSVWFAPYITESGPCVPWLFEPQEGGPASRDKLIKQISDLRWRKNSQRLVARGFGRKPKLSSAPADRFSYLLGNLAGQVSVTDKGSAGGRKAHYVTVAQPYAMERCKMDYPVSRVIHPN
uniref:RNA-directed RNA polymerase n=1 Tax=Vansystermes virus TaxID=2796636 RepID=A0A7T7GUZ6_9VIRU|nr:putative replicase [Vansystermes virus]